MRKGEKFRTFRHIRAHKGDCSELDKHDPRRGIVSACISVNEDGSLDVGYECVAPPDRSKFQRRKARNDTKSRLESFIAGNLKNPGFMASRIEHIDGTITQTLLQDLLIKIAEGQTRKRPHWLKKYLPLAISYHAKANAEARVSDRASGT